MELSNLPLSPGCPHCGTGGYVPYKTWWGADAERCLNCGYSNAPMTPPRFWEDGNGVIHDSHAEIISYPAGQSSVSSTFVHATECPTGEAAMSDEPLSVADAKNLKRELERQISELLK